MNVPRKRFATAPVAWPHGLERDALRDLATAFTLSLLAAVSAGKLAGFGAGYAGKVAVMLAVCGWIIWRGLPTSHPHGRLGPANRITLARLGVASMLAALLGQPLQHPAAAAWVIVVVATSAALLDLADGKLARSSGLASDFGARFDMETDAWFTLVLCSLVVSFGKAGAWILAAGLMRYGFVLAARALPWLSAPLPPSTRRKTVCVVQITLLITCLGPIIGVAYSNALAAVALALVTWSFAIDIRTLARLRQR